MYQVNTNDIIRVTARYTVGGQVCLNTMHYRYTGVPTITDGNVAVQELVVKIATDPLEGWIQDLLAMQSDEVTYQRIEGQKIYPTRYSPNYYAFTSTGGQTIPAYPPQVSLCITKKIELAQKGRVGRMECGGLPQDSSSAGLWDGSVITNGNLVADRLMTSLTVTSGGPFVPILFNKAVPANSQPLTFTGCEVNVRVLRRRTVGLGI